MKHIKKKYLFQGALPISNINNHQTLDLLGDNQELLKQKSKDCFVGLKLSESGEMIYAFIYNHKGKYINIPLPDYTLVYYNFAYSLNIERKKQQEILLSQLSNVDTITHDCSNELFNFYGLASSYVVNLFTSIESFINSMLPDGENYIVDGKNKTEVYNKTQIQENVCFMDKLKIVLPQFHKKNFFKDRTPTNQHIINLKELRDEIVHTKSDIKLETSVELFRRLLNFKYDETLDSVASLMNFYKPNYIEACSCGKDF